MDTAQLEVLTNMLGRVMDQFRYERFIFLGIAVLSALLALYAVVSLIRNGGLDAANIGTIFGSTGLMAAASLRVGFFLNRTFDLIEIVVRGAGNSAQVPGTRA